MADLELKPCPFCGGEANIEQSIIGGLTVCCEVTDCVAAGPLRDTEAEVITAWNTRHPDPKALAVIAEAREALEQSEMILSGYVEFLHRMPADEIELHPYIPSVEDAFDRSANANLTLTAFLNEMGGGNG